jgi:hypothetical protein
MTAVSAMTQEGRRRSNVRTALVLASIAAAFFVGVVLKHWLFGG